MNLRMDGWMDGRMDERMDWMDGWIDRIFLFSHGILSN